MTHALEGQGQRPWFSRQPPRLDHLLPCMDQRRLQFSKYLASSFISILRHGHPAHAHARLRARSTCARIGANFNDPASNYARNGPMGVLQTQVKQRYSVNSGIWLRTQSSQYHHQYGSLKASMVNVGGPSRKVYPQHSGTSIAADYGWPRFRPLCRVNVNIFPFDQKGQRRRRPETLTSD